MDVLPTEELWARYFNTRAFEWRDLLLDRYLKLVHWIAGQVAAGLPRHVTTDDLFAIGVHGLLRAVERFDPERRVKFESFASLLIRGAMIDELRALDWVPRSVHRRGGEIARVTELLRGRLGREPEERELAVDLGLSVEELWELRRQAKPAILVPLTDAEEGADARALNGFDVADRNEQRELLKKALSKLDKQERQVLRMRYFEGKMLKEIGKKMGLCESRVSQIHTKALANLREVWV
jgi:RNA polymerase sigma factor FliA